VDVVVVDVVVVDVVVVVVSAAVVDVGSGTSATVVPGGVVEVVDTTVAPGGVVEVVDTTVAPGGVVEVDGPPQAPATRANTRRQSHRRMGHGSSAGRSTSRRHPPPTRSGCDPEPGIHRTPDRRTPFGDTRVSVRHVRPVVRSPPCSHRPASGCKEFGFKGTTLLDRE
jgi:hypothetical protein